MGFFFKSITWSRRIVLKQLQDKSGSIKRRKVPRKKCWSYTFESFWGHFAIWAMHDTRRSPWKNQDILIFFRTSKFSKLFFSEKKNFFFDPIFLMIQNLIILLIRSNLDGVGDLYHGSWCLFDFFSEIFTNPYWNPVDLA